MISVPLWLCSLQASSVQRGVVNIHPHNVSTNYKSLLLHCITPQTPAACPLNFFQWSNQDPQEQVLSNVPVMFIIFIMAFLFLHEFPEFDTGEGLCSNLTVT